VTLSNRNGKSRLPEDPDQHRPGSRPYLTVTTGSKPADLMAEARAAGLHNLPRADATQLSGPEDAIVSEHTRRHVTLVERARRRLSELTASFAALEDRLPSARDLALVVEAAAAQFKGELGDERLLVPERRQQQGRLRDLRHLVAERNLTRPARYPHSRRLHLAWVGLLATTEAICNAGFFANLSHIGWVGGLSAAIVIAALNTGSAVLVGYTCLRGLHHHRAGVRRISGVGAAVYVVVAVGFNLIVGRARDLAAAGELTQQSVTQLLRHPFELSLLSAALVGLGLLAVAIALAKGRSLDDVAPHYGHLHRRHVDTDKHFVNATDALRQRAMAHVEAVPGRLHAEVERMAGIVEQLEAIVVEAEKTPEVYESDRQHLQLDCTRLLRAFRSANEQVRSAPPPSYFRELPALPSQLDTEPVVLLKRRLTAAHGRLDEFKVEAHRLKGSQPQRIESATDRFEQFYTSQLRRADAGRGDPGDGADTLQPEARS
jgi:hypothetical protein